MKKWTRYLLLMPVLLVQALSSCSLIDEPEAIGEGSVKVSLAFMISNAEKSPTRMAEAVVQENGSAYRGLEILSLTPFAINGETFANNGWKIVDTDASSLLLDDTIRVSGTTPTFYFYMSQNLTIGTNAFLVYGRAPQGGRSKMGNGSLLLPTNLNNPNLATLRFKPDSIYTATTTTPPAGANLLAGYLNHIAKTEGWSNTDDAELKNLFLSFTGQNNEENKMVAGSTTNIMAHVNALHDSVNALTNGGQLKTDILNSIQNYTADGLTVSTNGGRLTGLSINYPANIGLPDGAAALRWDNNEFVPKIKTTPLDNINSIGRFCYPAELFYYVNSRIDTSNGFVEESVYKTQTDWNTVRNQYEYQPGKVTASTRSVAIHEPLQYAVGRLKMTMKAVTTTGKLKDAKGNDVTLTADAFPLTGIIVCNQHPVGFNFKPVLENGAASHADDRFIYDNQVKKSNDTYYYLTTAEQSLPTTLVLQTYDTGEGNDKKGAEDVNIVMEFQNNSGQTFYGKSCVIYPETKFYLIGQIKPSEATSSSEASEAKGRVFTQDYVTTVNTKVESLANAYNVLPDLIGGRLELGIELVSSWVQAETTNVILK